MQDVIRILTDVRAIMPNDHFVGTSGRHFDTYINKDALYPHVQKLSDIGRLFAEKHKTLDIDVVAGPAMGGILLSTWTAFHLSELKHAPIQSIYAEKKDGVLTLTRGYDTVIQKKNVLVVEDLTTTGGSLKQVIDSIRQAGGNVLAASVMVNRDPQLVTEKTFGVPFLPLAELSVPSYEPTECPFCKEGRPINTSIGHGAKFIRENI